MSDNTNVLNEGITYGLRLVLDNDQGCYLSVRDVVRGVLPQAEDEARRIWPDGPDSPAVFDVPKIREGSVRATVGEALRDMVEEWVWPDHEDGPDLVLMTLVKCAMGDVEWSALAGAYIDEVREAEALDS